MKTKGFDFFAFYQSYKAALEVINDTILRSVGIVLTYDKEFANAALSHSFSKELNAITMGKEISEEQQKWLFKWLTDFPELFKFMDFSEIMQFLVEYTGKKRPSYELYAFLQQPQVMEKLHKPAHKKFFASLMVNCFDKDRHSGPHILASWLFPNFIDLPEVLGAVGRRIEYLEEIGMFLCQNDEGMRKLRDLFLPFAKKGEGIFDEEEAKLLIKRSCTYPHETFYMD